MNLSTISRRNYNVFAALDPSVKNEQIATAKYIEFLASNTNIDISDWNLFEIFGAGAALQLFITDRREINKRFFETHKNGTRNFRKSPTYALYRFITEEPQIREKLQTARTVDQGRLEQEIANLQRNFDSYQRQADAYLSNLLQKKEQLAAIQRADLGTVLYQEFLKIAMSDFWNYYRTDTHTIRFVTAQDVILTQRNPAAGVNIQVNMGRYQVCIDVRTMTVKLGTFRGNLNVNGYFHPYFNSNGAPCFGNVQAQANTALANMQISRYMDFLQAILTTYADSTPYQALNSFHAATQLENVERFNSSDPEPAESGITEQALKDTIRAKVAYWLGETDVNPSTPPPAQAQPAAAPAEIRADSDEDEDLDPGEPEEYDEPDESVNDGLYIEEEDADYDDSDEGYF